MKNILTAILLFFFPFSMSFAHHGIFAFDHNQEIEITGTISKLRFVNPHSWLHLDVTNANGITESWQCELRSASILKRSGWSAEMFVVGEEVTIKGSPSRRKKTDCYLGTITFANGASYDRYAQIDKNQPIKIKSLPERLANGDPNINGDWAAEQRVLTDPTGVSGAFVPLSVAEKIQAGGELPDNARPFPGGRGAGDINFDMMNREDELTEAGLIVLKSFDNLRQNPRFNCQPTSIIFDWTFDTEVNQIIQNESTIVLKYGFMPLERTIHLNLDTHPEMITPSIVGHSIGHWQNDVLHVDTIGFKSGLLTSMGFAGFKPNSKQMHIKERIYLNEDKTALIREYEVDDVVYLKNTHHGRDMVLRSDYPYERSNCVPTALE
jgi:hypothetical protein